jgi:hypothetical protein
MENTAGYTGSKQFFPQLFMTLAKEGDTLLADLKRIPRLLLGFALPGRQI